jgi:hypothetical protein
MKCGDGTTTDSGITGVEKWFVAHASRNLTPTPLQRRGNSKIEAKKLANKNFKK